MINRIVIDKAFRLAASKRPVAIDSVPTVFQESLREFIEGRTLLKAGNSWMVHFSDYMEWLDQMYYGKKVDRHLTHDTRTA